jgi:XTP/dITP diphosphohydrolase
MPRNSVHARRSDPRRDDARRERLVIATANSGKLREFRDLLADLPYEIVSLEQLGRAAPEETGSSFLENAVIKARHASKAADAAAIADDSGLEVDVLGGAPGIFSARYSGADATDAANNAKLLAALKTTPAHARTARYRCVLVFVDRDSDDTAPLVAEGVWNGCIVETPRGTAGFGYDPYFWLPELRMTAAELSPAEKNRRSHRGTAMRGLLQQLAARGQLAARAQPAAPGP